jgi:hypothetical protein
MKFLCKFSKLDHFRATEKNVSYYQTIYLRRMFAKKVLNDLFFVGVCVGFNFQDFF